VPSLVAVLRCAACPRFILLTYAGRFLSDSLTPCICCQRPAVSVSSMLAVLCAAAVGGRAGLPLQHHCTSHRAYVAVAITATQLLSGIGVTLEAAWSRKCVWR
jgi:hypothetical protein